MEIDKLIELSTKLLKEASYSSGRIYTYNWLWKGGILPYMQFHKIQDYTVEVGNDFMLTCNTDGIIKCKHRDMIKSVDILNHVLTSGEISGRRFTAVVYKFEGQIGEDAQNFIDSLVDLRRNPKTLHIYRRWLSLFTEELCSKGIQTSALITEDAVLDFVSANKYRISHCFSVIRNFLRFLYEQNLIERDFSYMMKSYSKKLRSAKERMPSFYTADEVAKLENRVSRSSDVGKRDYAMILLASRLGLRISDIANIKFENIDWDASEIHLLQFKTGNPLTLPLLPIVGDAIIDYLRYGRKKSSSDHVFLSCKPPYGPVTVNGAHNAIARAFLESGIDIGDRHHGPHALRFSLAQRMLEDATPMPIITSTLGHQKSDMTRQYVRIDLPMLRICTLDVPIVPETFYTQKGGCFYGK